jgi:hypothetical protein
MLLRGRGLVIRPSVIFDLFGRPMCIRSLCVFFGVFDSGQARIMAAHFLAKNGIVTKP